MVPVDFLLAAQELKELPGGIAMTIDMDQVVPILGVLGFVVAGNLVYLNIPEDVDIDLNLPMNEALGAPKKETEELQVADEVDVAEDADQ